MLDLWQFTDMKFCSQGVTKTRRSQLAEVMNLAWQFIKRNGYSRAEALKIVWVNNKLKAEMRKRIVKFYFQKVDGTIREAYGTLSNVLIPASTNENGLSVTQLVEEDNSVMSVLMHSSGQWIASKIRIPAKDGSDAQAIGSAITYAKRYGYCAILGIVADDDDDANIALGNQYAKSQNQPQQQQRRATQPKEKKVFNVSNLTNLEFFKWLAELAEENKSDPAWTLEKFIKDRYVIQDETYNELEGQYKYFITNKTL